MRSVVYAVAVNCLKNPTPNPNLHPKPNPIRYPTTLNLTLLTLSLILQAIYCYGVNYTTP